MPTVSSTLKLFDSMTRPLQNITQSMNLMISAMYEMQDAANQNNKIDKTLAAAKKQLAVAESEITRSIEESNRAQEKFNNSVHRSSNSTSTLLGNIKQMAAAYLTFRTAKTTGEKMLGGAMTQQQMIDTFSARAGSAVLGNQIYDQVVRQALALRQDVDASLAGTMSYMSNTLDPTQLVQLNKLAIRLSKLNPTEGLSGAAFSLKELMSGDYTSIAERFNISRKLLQDSAARQAGLNGDITGFIKGMDELLNQQKMTEEAFEKMLDSPAARWSGILQTFKFELADAGKAGLNAFVPLIETLDQALKTGRFQPFFNAMGTGLFAIIFLLNMIVTGFLWLGDVVQSSWFIIEPIFWLAISMLGTWLVLSIGAATVALYGMAKAMLINAAGWVMLHSTIFIVILAVALLVKILLSFGVTTDQIIGFVAGLFGALYVTIYNVFAQIYNLTANITEFFLNFWQHPIITVERLFIGLADTALGVLQRIAEAMDFVFKSNMSKSIQGWRSDLNSLVADLPEGYKVVKRMQELSFADTVNNAYGAGAGFIGKISSKLNGLGGFGDAANTIANINRVNEVGKINDTVDISSEDLKVMRELAEMKSIQNFVTLTPMVSVQTGDVRSEADIDTIVDKIKVALEEDIASSAARVYA